VLHNLRLVGETGATGGLLFRGISGAALFNVCCSDFRAGYGMKFDGGAGNVTMYNELVACQANNCQTGIWGVHANGAILHGGLLDANNDKANAVVPGSTGIRWTGGDSLQVHGTRFQSYETHLDVTADDCSILGTRHEAWVTGIRIAGNYATVIPSSMDNSFYNSGAGVAIALVSGTNAFINSTAVRACQTRVQRGAAVKYVIFDNGRYESAWQDGQAGLLLGTDVNLYRPNGVPNVLRTDDQFRAGDGVVTKVLYGVNDAGFTAGAVDGLLAIDAANNRLCLRYNGAWHHIAVTG
jgi:hypothetical protein